MVPCQLPPRRYEIKMPPTEQSHPLPPMQEAALCALPTGNGGRGRGTERVKRESEKIHTWREKNENRNTER